MNTPLPNPPQAPSAPASSKPGLEWWGYLIGFCCLIPLFGLFAAAAAIVLGILKFRQGGWILFLLAFLGIGVTAGLGYFLVHGVLLGNKGLFAVESRKELTLLVQKIEDYKDKNGKYPESLESLKTKTAFIDPFTIKLGDQKGAEPYLYILQPDGKTYYLFSRGPDGEAFTADDIFPDIPNSQAATIGYRERPLNPLATGTSATPVTQP
jgi:hypothetical protein